MADAAGGAILELCKYIYAAADAVESHKRRSKRLKERVRRLEQHLLHKVQKLPSFALEIEELLRAIHKFLKEREVKQVVRHFFTYQRITSCFAKYTERLNELVADLNFVDAAADVLQDEERADFEEQQLINRELLPPREARQTNKQLQLEAQRAAQLRGSWCNSKFLCAVSVSIVAIIMGLAAPGTLSRRLATTVKHKG
jgi:small-conductance mechanosensitive channel